MADNTQIEWTDATWNPITGCSVVSPGCTNCYAMKLAGGRLQHHPSRAGLTSPSRAGPVWNGQVRFNEDQLALPLRWTRPRRIFVCAHGDLFHEAVPDSWIDQVFAVMALSPQHTFQVLTKRPERMRAWFASRARPSSGALYALLHGSMMTTVEKSMQAAIDATFPLPNVWLGVSAEDQARADERIPILLDTPAAVRFLSAEPLLGAIDLRAVRWPHKGCDCETSWPTLNGLDGSIYCEGCCEGAEATTLRGLDWVIVGGESGPGARPMHPDWARQIRDDCADAGVAFHFKQWGDWQPRDSWAVGIGAPAMVAIKCDGSWVDDEESPDDVGGWRLARVGKKAAGRLLDGVTHDGFPGEVS